MSQKKQMKKVKFADKMKTDIRMNGDWVQLIIN